VLYKQISLLLIKVPAYKQYLQLKLIPEIVSQFQGIDPVVGERIGEAIQSVTNDLLNLIIRVVQNLWGYTLATVNVAAFIFFVPIIMIYLLRDWRAIIETFKKSENLNLGEEVWIVISDINKSLSSYIRGQLNVCAIMILFYSGTLSVLSLDGALLIGIFSGIAIIVPIVGTVAAFATSLLVGFLSFGYSSELYYIVFIYATGHIIESYIVSPKIIGDKIGVHPLWIMFSVLASGELLGFIGILFAVPIASILNVLISYVVRVFSSKTIEKL
jgi:putative permease